MPNTILIISTLDTKLQETLYLRNKLNDLGLTPVLMDISMRGAEASPADITPDHVAAAGGSSFDEIRISQNRSQITTITMAGACRLAAKLLSEGRLDGIIGLGGSTGSLMATEVMRALPFGLPKVMVSSTAALPGLSTRYIGTGDIALFHSVIEISGVTNVFKNVADRAASALAGMVQGVITPLKTEKGKAIALTMLGPCEKCARFVRDALEQKEYQVIGFSAAGIGDRAMESMIAAGHFHGVVDLAPGGVGEHIFGYMRDAGPQRMETAGKFGLPQLISTCSVNHMTPAKSKYKPEFHERPQYDLDKFRTWIRLSAKELEEVAAGFAAKLNMASGPVIVVIPLDGWSSVDAPGNPTYDPQGDRIFIRKLRQNLKPEIPIVEIQANMEEPTFANAVVELALEIF